MVTSIEQLPVLGVGASLSLSAEPDPVELVQEPAGPQFVEYAARVNAVDVHDEVARIKAAGAPVLFHPSYINFCGSFSNSDEWLQATQQHIDAVESPWFAQDCAYCFWDKKYSYSTQLGYFIPPIFNEASLQQAITRIREVQEKVDVPVAIEPPPMTFVVGEMTLCEFFGRLANETSCALLLDMGHLVSYEMASGRRFRDELSTLPLERVIEVHIAGGKLRNASDGPVYVDAHENQILNETWEMFEQMVPHLPQVKAVCFECEGVNKAEVMKILSKVRDKVMSLSSNQLLVNAVKESK